MAIEKVRERKKMKVTVLKRIEKVKTRKGRND